MGRTIRYIAAGILLLADTAIAPAQVVIQELLYDGPGSDADDVFTELVGPPGLSLEGWSLVGINGDSGASYRTVDLSAATLPADGVFVVATESAGGQVMVARDFVGSVDWQNGPDAVRLLNAAGEVVDALQYGDAGPFNAGEGVPAATVAAGQSLAREEGAPDTGDNFADFSAQEIPSPGLKTAAGITVALPDTVVVAGDSVDVDLLLTGVGASEILAFEAFVTFDREVARIVGADLMPSTSGPEWTLVWNPAAGTGTTIDTVKVAAASGNAPLIGDGSLLRLRFSVPAQTAPAATPLTIQHLLLNDGAPGGVAAHGSLTVAGRDGTVTVAPQRAIPPDILEIVVVDADEDRTGAADAVTVRVTDGDDNETMPAIENGAATGLFTVGLVVQLGAPIVENGILETAVGRTVEACYQDSLDAAGQTVEHCFEVAIYAGSDGRLEITQVSQPGDTLRVRVVDADLNTDPAAIEFAEVELVGPASGDREQLVMSEAGVNDSTFIGSIATIFAIGSSGDGTLTTGGGADISAHYFDQLSSSGDTATKEAASEVVELFGDADGNGLVQAFDASRVLAHVIDPFLAGSDSLAANVDSLAPAGAITPFDASLILQRLVGARRTFPVQTDGAANQPGVLTPVGKSASDIRTLSVRVEDRVLTIALDDRRGIFSGAVEIEGTTGEVELPPALSPFLVAWRASGNGVRVAMAGAVAATGRGEILRIRLADGDPVGRLPRVQAAFNDGRIVGAVSRTVDGNVPVRATLHANYPNPFNTVTRIRFDVPGSQRVELDVFDPIGQRIRTLWSGDAAAGHHAVYWDGLDDAGLAVGTGVYLYRLRLAGQVGAERQVRRMLLLK